MGRFEAFPDAAFVAPTAPSFADVLARLDADTTLSPSRRRDLASAVRRLAEALRPGLPLRDLPADPEWCRARIARIAPAAIGVTPKTWNNIASNFARALDAAGIRKPRFEIALTGAWAELWAKVRMSGDTQIATGLSRFPRYCQSQGIEPADVTDDVLGSYAKTLRETEVKRDPADAVYRVARVWNLAALTVDGWPQTRLTPPDRRRTYALPWAAFPPTLRRDVKAWLSMEASDDIFAEGPVTPLAPSTRKLREGSILRFELLPVPWTGS